MDGYSEDRVAAAPRWEANDSYRVGASAEPLG